ncbi:MAG: hypothetical protein ACLRL6_11735 [Clostridium sp.]
MFVDGGRTYVDTSKLHLVPNIRELKATSSNVTAFGEVYELGENNDLSCFLYGMDDYTLSIYTTNEEESHETLEKIQSKLYTC